MASAIALVFLRGVWIDEMWTIWLTEPGVPLALAYDRWLHDTQHPPLYYFVQWLLSPMTGTSLPVRRLVHLPLLLSLVVPTLLIVRRNTPATYLALVAVAFATNPYFINYFAEHRSYYLAMISLGCLTLLIRFFHLEAAAGRPVRWPAYACLFFTAFSAINLHYTFALVSLALVGCSILAELRLRHLRLSLILAVTAAIAVAPLLVHLLLALNVQRPEAANQLSVQRGFLIIMWMLAAGLVGNPPLAWFAAQGAWSEIRRHREVPRLEAERRSFAVILAATLIVCALGFAAMHLITRNIIPRLVLGVLPPSIVLVAELASWRPVKRREFRLVCLAGVALVVATTWHQARNLRWAYHLRQIKQILVMCPSTRVFAITQGPRLKNPAITERQVPQWAQVFPFSYRLLGRQNGFIVEIVPQPAPLSIRDISCPVLLWREHEFVRPNRTAAEWLSAANVAADPRQIAASRVQAVDSHILVIVPPVESRALELAPRSDKPEPIDANPPQG